MKRFLLKYEFIQDKGYPVKTELFVMSSQLLFKINSWSDEIELDIACVVVSVPQGECHVMFGFRTERDLSMFMLRWSDAFGQEYLNSHSYQMHRIIEQMSKRIIDLGIKNDLGDTV